MLDAKLIVVGGDAKSKQVSLRLPTVIGRGKDVTLTLPHALVSRKHTEIFEQDGWLFVKDLGSLNGTYVNNRRIREAQKLPPNHLLTLGNVTFRAVYEAPSVTDVSAEAENPTDERNDDETINIDEMLDPSNAHRNATSDSSGEANEKSLAKSTAERPTDSTAESKRTPDITIERNDSAQVASPASSIFSGYEEFITPEKSISLSALEGLPVQPTASSVSFMGSQLKDIAGAKKPSVDSVDLDVPEAGPSAPSDVDLGSFLRKIPR
jgi:pSer/pThr/pTyr-binding forkhead associated (FHA) protein